MVFPFITFTGIRGGLDLGDIEFLKDKEIAGNLVSVLSSSFNTTGDKISYTVPSGKTFYLVKVSLIPVTESSSSTTTILSAVCNATIKFDTTEVDALGYSKSYQGTTGSSYAQRGYGLSFSNIQKLDSTVIGESMVGNGVKNIIVNISSISNITFRVVLLGFLT